MKREEVRKKDGGMEREKKTRRAGREGERGGERLRGEADKMK